MKYSCWQLSVAAVWEIQRERRDFQAVTMLSGEENNMQLSRSRLKLSVLEIREPETKTQKYGFGG